MQLQNVILALAAAATAQAGVIERANACSSYTIINTRGTGELQGPSAGFRTMNSNIQRQLSGGKVYNTVYAADASQNSAAGTADIVRKVQSTLQTNPNECFFLEGYSQGAAATTNALPKLTGVTFLLTNSGTSEVCKEEGDATFEKTYFSRKLRHNNEPYAGLLVNTSEVGQPCAVAREQM